VCGEEACADAPCVKCVRDRNRDCGHWADGCVHFRNDELAHSKAGSVVVSAAAVQDFFEMQVATANKNFF